MKNLKYFIAKIKLLKNISYNKPFIFLGESMRKLFVVVAFIAVFIQACGLKKSVALEGDGYYYGEGRGVTFELAKQNAIKDLTTNLQVSVKYTSTNTTTQTNDTLQYSGSTNVSLESQIKDLPAIEVYKQSKKKNNHEVEVRLSKATLKNQMLTRVQKAQGSLDSMIGACKSTSFKNHEDFKRTFKEYSGNVALYQIAANDFTFGSDSVLQYQNIAASEPKYSVKISFEEDSPLNKDVERAIFTELSKIIKIDNNSNMPLEIQVDNTSRLVLHFDFYDCQNKLEDSKKVDTFTDFQSFSEKSKLARLGPIIYKALED